MSVNGLKRKREIGLLAGLLLVLAVVVYVDFRPSGMPGTDAPRTVAVEPLRIPNPALHLNRLAELRKMDYTGDHRNIFSATLPPPKPSTDAKQKAAAAAAAAAAASTRKGPAEPPGLHVPLTFYGMATDPKTGQKLAFFTSGDKVLIASSGQTLLGHFRLLQIGRKTVEFEDVGTGQLATLTMTPPVTPPAAQPQSMPGQ